MSKSSAVGKISAKLTGTDFLPGWATEPHNPFRQQVEAAMKAVGMEPQLYAAPYGSNANAVAGEHGIATLILGPGDVSRAHRVNERISIQELLLAARIYGTIVECNPSH